MKKHLNKNVYEAALERISWVFDNFPRIYISFSGGKDSGVMMHLVLEEAAKRRKKVGVLFVDLEAQYKLTIDYIGETFFTYAGNIDPFWVALPINLRNAVSQYEPQWLCWDPDKKKDWVRQLPRESITTTDYFPFFHSGMEFEEFVPEFGKWYSQGQPTACFVGIRTDESLNRWRTIAAGKKQSYEGKRWTTWCRGTLWNIYPIYDWRTRDIWVYNGKYKKQYNRLYDRMWQAGLTIHQARICQPYGDDQRRGLWLFQIIEPETWARVVARVNGANQGALYSQESGNILGNLRITKPENLSWECFALSILESMPPTTKEHYKNKIAVFLQWYKERGYKDGIPDEGNATTKESPSWTRICKALLRNDYWCKGLSFSQHKSSSYKKYLKLMKKRRQEWGLI